MSLLAAFADGNRDALAAMVSDDVVFNSPATAYRGRDQVVDVLAIAGPLFKGLTASRAPATIAPGETLTMIEASVEGEPINGILLERTDEAGRITELTILLRPLGTLETALRHIARALAEGGGAP